MRIDDFLKQHPWERTRDELFGNTPQPWPRPSLDIADNRITRQRETQVDALARLMLSPVVDEDFAHSGGRDREDALPIEVFRLRDARRTARLYVDRLARTGKELRDFHQAEIASLDRDNAVLGQFLQLIARARAASRTERRALSQDWRALSSTGADLGRVLSPMARRNPPDEGSASLAGELAVDLAKRSQDPGTDLPTREGDELLRWSERFLRQGSKRLQELGE